MQVELDDRYGTSTPSNPNPSSIAINACGVEGVKSSQTVSQLSNYQIFYGISSTTFLSTIICWQTNRKQTEAKAQPPWRKW